MPARVIVCSCPGAKRFLSSREAAFCIIPFYVRCFRTYVSGMTAIESEILKALADLDSTVRNLLTANPKPDLRALFQRIDDLTFSLPRTTDPSLLHYLHKKSYEKARLFLEGRDAENAQGNCGHVA